MTEAERAGELTPHYSRTNAQEEATFQIEVNLLGGSPSTGVRIRDIININYIIVSTYILRKSSLKHLCVAIVIIQSLKSHIPAFFSKPVRF